MAALALGAVAVAAGTYALWPNPAENARPYAAPSADEMAPGPAKEKDAWSTRPDEGRPIRYAKKGYASVVVPTIPTAFKQAVQASGNKPALRFEKAGYPKDAAGEWETYTWAQYYDKSVAFAKALIAVGHKPYQATAICGFNNAAWHVSHMGTIFACGLSAGTYTTNSPDACAFVASDSNSIVAVVDTLANAKKYLQEKKNIPSLKRIVVWAEAVPTDLSNGGLVVTFEEFIESGKDVPMAKVEERMNATQVQNCATLIYTSGTTGNPKAVMASHDALLYAANVAISTMECSLERIISYLPLSHIAAQMLDIMVPLWYAAQNSDKPSICVYFARPDVLKGSLPITLKAVRPDFFFGVPRVWEKFVEGIKAKARATPATGLKKKIVDFAKDVGLRGSYARQSGGDGYIPRGYGFAKKKVFSAVRDALGLDQCKIHLTGAAPIARETLEFLASLGIDITEAYGMSETCGVGVMGLPYRFKFGSCGFVTPTQELKVDHVEGRDKPGEGEICFRGRHVMMGYMNNDAKTREAIDGEGWMHSGDVGRIDKNGHVYITGRIKELIIGAGGENIAPVPIEERLKALLPALSNIVMVGNKRKFNTMLVTIKSKPNLDTGDFTDELFNEATEVNPAVKTVTEARKDAKWRAYIQAGLDKYNKEAVSQAQKIQKFAILAKDLSVPGGDLTATLKLKRNVVEEKYADDIDGLYAGEE